MARFMSSASTVTAEKNIRECSASLTAVSCGTTVGRRWKPPRSLWKQWHACKSMTCELSVEQSPRVAPRRCRGDGTDAVSMRLNAPTARRCCGDGRTTSVAHGKMTGRHGRPLTYLTVAVGSRGCRLCMKNGGAARTSVAWSVRFLVLGRR